MSTSNININCLFCSKNFSKKNNFNRHIRNKTCSLINLQNAEKLLEFHEKLSGKNISTTIITGNTINNNIQIINILPANKLNVAYLKTQDTKELVETSSLDRANILLSGYIKEIIANKDHPENQCVKYISKRPPTFSSVVEENGENKVFVKNLKDSCEILSAPIMTSIKQRLRACKKELKDDEDFQDEYQTNRNLHNKDNVKKALSSVLQNDILNNPEFKC